MAAMSQLAPRLHFFFYQSSSIELIFLEKISEDKFLKMDDAFHLDTSLIVSYNYNEFE